VIRVCVKAAMPTNRERTLGKKSLESIVVFKTLWTPWHWQGIDKKISSKVRSFRATTGQHTLPTRVNLSHSKYSTRSGVSNSLTFILFCESFKIKYHTDAIHIKFNSEILAGSYKNKIVRYA